VIHCYDTLRSEAPMSPPERQALTPRHRSSFSRSTAVGVESEPNSITIISPATMHVRTLVKLYAPVRYVSWLVATKTRARQGSES
jgi:hypothetical protein